jgi:hypothetical protein
MRTRSTVTAAFALAAATILTVAACGSSVTGSAQPNSAAAVAAETTAIPPELTTLLSDLPTELTIPTDLTFPTDFTIPTDITGLEDLTNLEIPGYNGECISVSLAYLAVTFAPFATLAGGSGQYDAAELQKAFEDLKTEASIPPEIAPDIQALEELAQQASGATLSEAGELFGSEKFTTASNNISAWLDANCAGG